MVVENINSACDCDYMNVNRILFLLVAAMLSSWSVAEVVSDEVLSYKYEIFSDESPVGYYEEHRKKLTDGHLQVIRDMQVSVSNPFWRVDYLSNDLLLFDGSDSAGYRLKKIDRRVKEDGKIYQIQGARENNVFAINAGVVENLADPEQSFLSDFAFAVATASVPYLGTVLSIFPDEDKGGKMILSDKDYQATVEDIPYLLNQVSEAPKLFRLIDTQRLKVDDYTLSLILDEECPLKNISPCYKARVVVANYQHNYWLSADKFGPYLLQADGVDEDGHYRIEIER